MPTYALILIIVGASLGAIGIAIALWCLIGKKEKKDTIDMDMGAATPYSERFPDIGK